MITKIFFRAQLGMMALAFVLGSLSVPAWAKSFPEGPHPVLTPGSLCDQPDAKRYPERIDYCQRDVDSRVKRRVIQIYDQKLGYHVGQMNRQDFKIDHYIPLCAGGSNDITNLWPQHRSVYEITDPMEQLACEKMAQGALSQREALELIRMGKNDLEQVAAILDHLENL